MTSTRVLTEAFACTHATNGYVMQARAHSGPVQDVACGVEVPVHRQAAVRAFMLPRGKVLGDSGPASGAILSRIVGIHLDQTHTGPLCLVAHHREEHGPRGIVDVLGQDASGQAFQVEPFNCNRIVIADQSSARLVQVLSPLTRYRRMAARQDVSRFATAGGSTLLAGKGPLCTPNSPLSLSGCPQARNKTAVRKRGENRNTQINTDRASHLSGFGGQNLHRETDTPALSVTPESAPLDMTWREIAVPMDPQAPWHALEPKSPTFQCNSRECAKSKTIEPASAAKPRESCLFPNADPTKETAIRFFKTLKRRALQAHRQLRGFRIVRPPLSETLTLIKVRKRLAFLTVSADALFKSPVIELALRFQDSFERTMLSLRGQKSEGKRENHGVQPTFSQAHQVSLLLKVTLVRCVASNFNPMVKA